MGEIKLITTVPSRLTKQLTEKKRLENTVINEPQVDKRLLAAIKTYMVDNIGYPNLPIACLSNMEKSDIGKEEIDRFLPTDSRDMVLLQIEMPEDMVVSVPVKVLMDCSEEISAVTDQEEVNFIISDFLNELVIGAETFNSEDVMSFIPFLDFDRCTCWAKLDENFNMAPSSNSALAALEQVQLKTITSFFN